MQIPVQIQICACTQQQNDNYCGDSYPLHITPFESPVFHLRLASQYRYTSPATRFCGIEEVSLLTAVSTRTTTVRPEHTSKVVGEVDEQKPPRIRSQKALHPSPRRIAPKIMDEGCKCQQQIFRFQGIDSAGMIVTNISNTRPGHKSISGKYSSVPSPQRVEEQFVRVENLQFFARRREVVLKAWTTISENHLSFAL